MAESQYQKGIQRFPSIREQTGGDIGNKTPKPLSDKGLGRTQAGIGSLGTGTHIILYAVTI
ncbi:hypothetical protein [Burkholderia pseudomallei]|uniref:hypothetical protein n=1 Tax=Burkholderia pseudomallei TaxID=28450 RepID=UPI000530F100|nr:hypothetical protein [Burkholderia pseudomallei]KGS42814.1 hypothetical protein X961_5195 [Burkholderia pseudomallei MSHR5613]MBM5591579.1 hypothetical protein [Burkholderia pseudomallei]